MASLKKRGPVYYIQFYQGEKQRRISTETGSFQQAKEKLRQFESAQARGEDSLLPTKTPIRDVLTGYVAHVRATKTLPVIVEVGRHDEGRSPDRVVIDGGAEGQQPAPFEHFDACAADRLPTVRTPLCATQLRTLEK